MSACELCKIDGKKMTLFRGLCIDCAEAEYTRIKLWFEMGDSPIATADDLDDFVLGALFSRYGKAGVLALNCWFVRPILDALPEQYVGVSGLGGIHWKGPQRRAGFDDEFAFEIKRPIPAELLRSVVNESAPWPDQGTA